MKNIQLIIITIGIGFFSSISLEASKLAGSKPNIVIIMPDDIGANGLRHLGSSASAPNMESIFERGVRFTDFHVSPTCAPSRAAMLSGRHECYTGVTHTIMMRDRMNLETRLITHVLKDAGYATGIFGKWHLGDDEAYLPDARGFDETYIHGAGGIGQNYTHSADFPNNDYTNPTIYHNGKVIRTEGYCTDLFFDQAIKWMDIQQKANTPFFCYIPPNVPHSPHIPPLKPDGTYHEKSEILLNLDANIGKVIKYLEQNALLEKTLLIYFSDNGGISYDRLRGSKNSPYQGGTKVPCAMYWKGVLEGGGDIHQLTAHIDFYTTFARLAGLESEPIPGGKDWDGKNLLPLFEEPESEWPKRYFITHKTRWKTADSAQYREAGIRWGDYQLVWPKKGNAELFNVVKDQKQTTDIQSQHPEIVKRLKETYDLWWADIQPYLINDNIEDVPEQHKPFHERYREAFGEEAFQAAMSKMTWQNSKPFRSKKKK